MLNPTHLSENVIDKQNEGIKFVQLIPGINHSEVINELREEINEALDGGLF